MLISIYENSNNLDAWGELMLAADFSHNNITGFGKTGDWTNHNIEGKLTRFTNLSCKFNRTCKK